MATTAAGEERVMAVVEEVIGCLPDIQTRMLRCLLGLTVCWAGLGWAGAKPWAPSFISLLLLYIELAAAVPKHIHPPTKIWS